ncbi:MAG: MalY/PatB family protein [Actinomycetota bacterium]
MSVVLTDLDENACRARGSVKWDHAPDGVLPAWVAETDFAPCPAVHAAVQDAVARGAYGYPPSDARTGLPEATAAFCARRWGWAVDPSLVVLTGDVMAGIRLVLETLCDKGPVVVPTPTYPPFLDVVPLTGRPLVPVPLDADAETAELDLDRVDAALAAGARTVLLCNPHNPWGRAFRREELEALRDVVLRHGARVISDDIHAPLVLPGTVYVPYASLPGTADHTTTVLSASKAFNVPGLKCGQIVTGTAHDSSVLRRLPPVANHGTSPLGIAANRAAYDEGGPWLDALVRRLAGNRSLLEDLVAQRLPGVRMRRLEATYLAWLDVRALAGDDPAAVALARGRVMVNDGATFGPGGEGHVRLNIATSPERLQEIVRRLATAWSVD